VAVRLWPSVPFYGAGRGPRARSVSSAAIGHSFESHDVRRTEPRGISGAPKSRTKDGAFGRAGAVAERIEAALVSEKDTRVLIAMAYASTRGRLAFTA